MIILRINIAAKVQGFYVLIISLAYFIPGGWAADLTSEETDFFENHIRPILIQNCYECHGGDPEKLEGGFNLTYRKGMLSSGDIGGNLVPGDVARSGLLEALEYGDAEFQMPPTGKLPDLLIDYVRRWIEMGAPDPRETAFEAEAEAEAARDSWTATLERRKSWWSYRPVRKATPPDVDGAWSKNPIDAFIRKGWIEAGIEPSEAADPYALIRRLSFVLIGLPPSTAEIDAFVVASEIDRQKAVEAAADRLLASPRFGERWARHWMDWMRYAETHGSEGDARIPHAWRYRDYLIRALNADVPYNDLVREHLAGDLLPKPRINEALGIVESTLGISQYRFVLHGFAPTDALDEQVRFTNDQIDTVTKAFLATTVSCARCHNHKFDPISQKDFYALYGIMASCRPATIVVDTAEKLNLHKEALVAKKVEIRSALAEIWLKDLDGIEKNFESPTTAWRKALTNATTPLAPLHAWKILGRLEDQEVAKGWTRLAEEWEASQIALKDRLDTEYPIAWDIATDDLAAWTQHGNGLGNGASKAGAFSLLPEGDRIVEGIYPAGVYTHMISSKHSGVLSSPRFELTGTDLYFRIAGDKNSLARYVVQNYPRDGTVYPVQRMKDGEWHWQHWNVDYWEGEQAYFEISTAPDQAILANDGEIRSWFGVTEAVMLARGQPAPRDEVAEFVSPLFFEGKAVKNSVDLIRQYGRALQDCIVAFRDGDMTDEQARFLDSFIRQGLLTNAWGASPRLDGVIADYRKLEMDIPVPTRAPGVLENVPFEQPLFERGSHLRPLGAVSRRFLEVIDSTPYGNENSGRLALAESIVREDNPLTPRVIANRLWHYVFGEGIVSTPDDFGAMGREPSHPELLDFLARRMMDDGWSMKTMVRLLVTSQTFQRSAVATTLSTERDPTNALLSHFSVRRLEGEAIRDSLLYVAENLNLDAPAGSVEGRSDRRSIYVRVIRNSMDAFLTTFDFPVPVGTKGRRDETNVPSHSLTFMNAPFVRTQAVALANLIKNDAGLGTDSARVGRMFQLALGRGASSKELEVLLGYLGTARERPAGIEYDKGLGREIDRLSMRKEVLTSEIARRLEEAVVKDADLSKLSDRKLRNKVVPGQVKELKSVTGQLAGLDVLAGPPEPWTELALSFFSLKEFIYLR